MTQQAYDQFVQLRADLPARGVSNLAHVFVPVGPTSDIDASKELRLLFVGRATRDYGEDRVSTYEGAFERDVEIVVKQNSPYWAFIRRIASCIHKCLDTESVCGWTNLAKIGDTKGNATPLSLSNQAIPCCVALRTEIALMKPHAIVIMTGNYAKSEIFEPVFGSDGWTSSEAPTTYKRHIELGTFLVHTYHPERKRGSREMAATIARLIVESMKSGSSDRF